MPPIAQPSVCPNCGVQVQKGVIRCRDCGAFLDQAADESSGRKSWPGLPEDAAQRAAEAAAAAMNVGDSGRTEQDLLHDMDFAESLFQQTEERIRKISDRKDEDFLLDVTPISEERHTPTIKKPPVSRESAKPASSEVKPIASSPPKPATPAAAPAKPAKAAAPEPVAPPAPPPIAPQSQPAAPADPYAGYGLTEYPPGYPGGPAGYPQQQGYAQQPYGQEYPPAAYPGYAQPYGYADYSAAAYQTGAYQQQYDPNYIAQQFGYIYDPPSGQYYDPSTGQYVADPTQQYGDPAYQLQADPQQAAAPEAAEELPELPADLEAPEATAEAEATVASDTPAEGEADAAAAAAAAEKAAEAATAEAAAVKSHSEETAGDILLAAALEEESNRGSGGGSKKPGRKNPSALKAGDSLLVFCPYGHRVQVQAKFRGKAGRCPLCKSTFFVPADLVVAEPEPVEVAAAPTSLDNRVWFDDVRLHRVNPAKVKFTPGSLAEDFDTVDVGLNADGLLVVVLFKSGALFRNIQEPKKKPGMRKAVREHLAAGKPLDQIPAMQQFLVKADALTQLKMLQPVKAGEESLFSGVPVFGDGRIVVRIPPPEAADKRWCLSFALAQFREFCRQLIELYGLADFSNTSGVPLEDEMLDVQCSFSGNPLQILEKTPFYLADSNFKLEVVGYKCQGCGAVVDASVRQEHKIGGKQESSIAKSKCPKCSQKFGENKLYRLVAEQSALPAQPPSDAAPAEAVAVAVGEPSSPEVAEVPSTDSGDVAAQDVVASTEHPSDGAAATPEPEPSQTT